jgi:hypothetical protein
MMRLRTHLWGTRESSSTSTLLMISNRTPKVARLSALKKASTCLARKMVTVELSQQSTAPVSVGGSSTIRSRASTASTIALELMTSQRAFMKVKTAHR